ncbi:GCN5-related N-acetyltransferase [Hymenobacter roseosalivarius DSM 11622]|uniref:GCN5-related N-acetyltransferase n=1 Tax=Hymenobacter roseosalivarius DSM 11622 TaxID=645990 RepID=A0A1W1W4Z2_9BACT|nr:GNAT family N-acetyltransferase [Hymenobacter roseosalivarius]SMC00154.1 GCN5-related N-acetyltransferase [Hymenobacter roseosalivarius DSM 11622]
MAELSVRSATAADAAAIQVLYRTVAEQGGGLARQPAEITAEYVQTFLTRSLATGIALVVERPEGAGLAGEIHTYSSGLQIFAHVMGELTVAVHPQFQGQQLGHRLFSALLICVQQRSPHTRRVELLVRESNHRAITLYEKLGFRQEGRLLGRVSVMPGQYEADIPMAWHALLFG